MDIDSAQATQLVNEIAPLAAQGVAALQKLNALLVIDPAQVQKILNDTEGIIAQVNAKLPQILADLSEASANLKTFSQRFK